MMTFKNMLTTLICSGGVAAILSMASLALTAEMATSGITNPPVRLQALMTPQNTDHTGSLPMDMDALLTTAIADPKGQQAAGPIRRGDEKSGSTQQQGRSSQPAFNRWPDQAKPVEKWMYGLLDKRCPENMQFRKGMSLAECLEFLADHFSIHHPDSGGRQRRLRFRGETMELALENLNSLNEIHIKTDIELDDVTLENALDILLADTGAEPEFAYEIRNETFFITTAAAAAEHLSTRIYSVPELLELDYSRTLILAPHHPEPLSPDSDAQLQPFFGDPKRASTKRLPKIGANQNAQSVLETQTENGDNLPEHPLQRLVMDLTSPTSLWIEIDAEGGTVHVVDNMLVVRQSYRGHREVLNLLNQLREASRQLAADVKEKRKLAPKTH